jgi:hypothetical protein
MYVTLHDQLMTTTTTTTTTVIGRAKARATGIDLNVLFEPFGGGGHPKVYTLYTLYIRI